MADGPQPGQQAGQEKHPVHLTHRRRMEREAKAKVFASVWGADFVQFSAALAVLPRSIWKNRRSSTVSSKPTKSKQLAQQGIEQNSFAFASLYILLL